MPPTQCGKQLPHVHQDGVTVQELPVSSEFLGKVLEIKDSRHVSLLMPCLVIIGMGNTGAQSGVRTDHPSCAATPTPAALGAP